MGHPMVTLHFVIVEKKWMVSGIYSVCVVFGRTICTVHDNVFLKVLEQWLLEESSWYESVSHLCSVRY